MKAVTVDRWASASLFTMSLLWIAAVVTELNRPTVPPVEPDTSDNNLIMPRANFNPSLAVGYEETMRDIWQKPEQVLEALEPLDGLVVADIGCGEGYFTLSLLDLVGPEGKVIATDIRADLLQKMSEKVPEEHRERIELVLSEGEGTGIQGTVDLILLIQVLGEVEAQRELLEAIKGNMHAESRLVLIDTRYVTDRNTGFTRPLNLRRLKDRLAQLGFYPDPMHESSELNFLSRQFFLVLKVGDQGS